MKPALTSAGASLDLWRVAVKPGKPFLFGHAPGCAIFGLPGQSGLGLRHVSVVRAPGVAAADGRERSRAIAAHDARDVDGSVSRIQAIGRITSAAILAAGSFTPVGRQESHALFGLSRSNALLLVKPGETIAAGATATVLTW